MPYQVFEFQEQCVTDGCDRLARVGIRNDSGAVIPYRYCCRHGYEAAERLNALTAEAAEQLKARSHL